MMLRRLIAGCLVLIAAVLGGALIGVPAQQQIPTDLHYETAYATFVGGVAWDQLREVIPYPEGSVLVGGLIKSSGMPTSAGAVQADYAGDDPALGHGGIYGGDGYLLHLSPDGSQVLAATYFVGSKQERGIYGMALDSEGNVVISSSTRSRDLPTTEGCYQPKYGGPDSDMYAAKLSSDFTELLWCTYVGGSSGESPRGGITVDEQDNVYIVGSTSSPDFPTTEGVFQRERKGQGDAAIVKLAPDGSELVFSTLLGGSDPDGVMGVRVDASGHVYVAGHTHSQDLPVTTGAPQPALGGKSDCFLTKLSSDASGLIYSTYLGGAENEFAEHRPWLCPDGSFLLTGFAGSPDFPTTAAAFQRANKGNAGGFLTKLAADGKSFVFSTLVGGSANDFFLMPTPDPEGNIFMVGQTSSSDFPVTANAVQAAHGGGKSDGVLAVLSPDGSRLLYATYLGGSGDDMIRSVALGPNGEVYLVGSTGSDDFPVTPNCLQAALGGGSDAFIVKLVPER